MILCPKCGHDNELGRIFCAGCGDKLDLSAVQSPEQMAKAGKKVKSADGKKMTPGQLAWKIINYGGMIAIVVICFLMWQQPPTKSIKASDAAHESALEKVDTLMSAAQSDDKLQQPVDLNEVEIASYIDKTVKFLSPDAGFNITPTKVRLELGANEVTAITDWTANLSTHKHAFVVKLKGPVSVKGGKIVFQPKSASVGKCPVPGFLREAVANKVGVLADLQDEQGKKVFRNILAAAAKQGQVKISDGKVSISTAPE